MFLQKPNVHLKKKKSEKKIDWINWSLQYLPEKVIGAVIDQTETK